MSALKAPMFAQLFFPIFARPFAGLKRVGLWAWRATNGDPHFVIRLRPRPRFVLILLDGGAELLDPMIYFDMGKGFVEDLSQPIRSAQRIACLVAVYRFPDARRLRFDPATHPTRFHMVTIGLPRLWMARRLVRLLNAFHARFDRPERSLYTVELIDGMEWGAVDGVWGSGAQISSLEHHFRHVVALGDQISAPAVVAGSGAPLVSLVVPLYNALPNHLDMLMASVLRQQAVSHELILSDDGSTREDTHRWLDEKNGEPGVTIIRGTKNLGIAAATNAGLAKARGDWVCLLDQDDALAPHALKLFARALERHPEARFIYTDELVTDSELRPTQYFAKPAFDPVLLSGVNYINHLSFFRRDRLLKLGGLDSGFQGSQDYDLLLRYLKGLHPSEVVHIPYPAYLWRRHEAAHSAISKGSSVENARKALVRFYGQTFANVTAEPALVPDLHRIRFDVPNVPWPLVSVIIPNRDSYDLISTVLDGLSEGTAYPALEIIIVDNGTKDRRVLALYERCKVRFPRFQLYLHEEVFNFSRAVNRGIAMASGDYVLLLNNDIEVIEPDWLTEMVSCFAYPDTGIVGARLLYPDRRIQHAGVIVGLGGLAGHWFSRAPATIPGPMGRLGVRQSLTAVTAAAMLISRACLDATGAFDEEAFAIAYNDVDFCLRAGARGFRIVWTPFATLIHHESVSRGSDERPETIERFQQEQARLRARHGTLVFEDRAFSPWYTRDRSNPIYKFRPDLPESR